MFFLSHYMVEKYFVLLLWLSCSREEENWRDAGNATMRHPLLSINIHRLLSRRATEVIHLTQSDAQTTCLHKYCVYSKRAHTVKEKHDHRFKRSKTQPHIEQSNFPTLEGAERAKPRINKKQETKAETLSVVPGKSAGEG